MNELTIKNYKGISVIDSREVAEMIGKRHADLLRSIDNYVDVLKNAKLRSSNFFIESTYSQSGNGKENPCYLLTKQGCEMVANKMTGKKGILFTAEYVQAFNKMEEAIKELQPTPSYMIDDPIERAKAWIKEQEKVKVLKTQSEYLKKILESTTTVTMTQIAKDYGMTAQEMNSLLHKLKVQYKQNDQWLLYSKYHKEGYVDSETIPIKHKSGIIEPKMYTKWTQKGRKFLYELLKENEILPVIEREDM